MLSMPCVMTCTQVKDVTAEYYLCRVVVLGPLREGAAGDMPGENFTADIKPCFGGCTRSDRS